MFTLIRSLFTRKAIDTTPRVQYIGKHGVRYARGNN